MPRWWKSSNVGRAKQRIYLIEDAAYRELRYEGDDVPSLRSFDPEGDTVLYAGTFSNRFRRVSASAGEYCQTV